MNKTAQEWIEQLNLDAHPEGGFYKRIYASQGEIQSNGLTRPICTSIHYLLMGDDFSAWHRIKSDEQWFFHAGAALTIYEIDESGALLEHTLGHQHLLSVVIPSKSWFCAKVNPAKGAAYSLVSCVVSPGFVFEEFELATAQELSQQFSEHSELIERFCRH